MSIFRSPGVTDPAEVAAAVTLSRPVAALVSAGRAWSLSSVGQLPPTSSLQAHLDWLLEAVVRPNRDALKELRRRGYWVSVVVHDYAPQGPGERARAEAELDLLDITFDFELERR